MWSCQRIDWALLEVNSDKDKLKVHRPASGIWFYYGKTGILVCGGKDPWCIKTPKNRNRGSCGFCLLRLSPQPPANIYVLVHSPSSCGYTINKSLMMGINNYLPFFAPQKWLLLFRFYAMMREM